MMMQRPKQQAQEHIKQTGIIAIVRGDFPLEKILQIGEALQAGGVSVMEVTLNSTGALEAIAALRKHFTKQAMWVGAGTVRTSIQVDQSLGAGAQFIVSPNYNPKAIIYSSRISVLHLPGVFTPSEAHNAFEAGCSMVKLFPADIVGPAYLKAIRAPLDDIDFVPTGGVGVHNVADYVKAGAAALGVGSSLISGKDQTLAEITNRAKALRAAWEQAKQRM